MRSMHSSLLQQNAVPLVLYGLNRNHGNPPQELTEGAERNSPEQEEPVEREPCDIGRH